MPLLLLQQLWALLCVCMLLLLPLATTVLLLPLTVATSDWLLAPLVSVPMLVPKPVHLSAAHLLILRLQVNVRGLRLLQQLDSDREIARLHRRIPLLCQQSALTG